MSTVSRNSQVFNSVPPVPPFFLARFGHNLVTMLLRGFNPRITSSVMMDDDHSDHIVQLLLKLSLYFVKFISY